MAKEEKKISFLSQLMLEKYFNNRIAILYITPFIIGSLAVFSFQPFNFTVINFFILPTLPFFSCFNKKKSKSTYRKNPSKKPFYLWNIFWIWILFKRIILDFEFINF